MRTNAEIVLSALMRNVPVEIDGQDYIWDGERLCIKAKKYKLQLDGRMSNPKDVLVGVDIPLSQFIKCCENMPPGEVTRAVANLALRR